MVISSGDVRQAGAIPVREGKICLVTSSSGKRWVIPKGCIEAGTTAGEIALQEAWEEAGLVGVLQSEPSGSYLYEKLGSRFHVTVFLLRVTEAADAWPEMSLRQRAWLKPEQALARLDDRGLQAILRGNMKGDQIELEGLSA